MQLRTIEQFVNACRNQSNDAIYELFEDNLSDELQLELYELAAEVDDCSPEPVRCVINHLGATFGVDAMKDY
jgi:predicted TIM-barrel fold metal-dependent hydrolase